MAASGQATDVNVERAKEEHEAAGAPSVEELTERLGGARLIERIRTQRTGTPGKPVEYQTAV
mgnify:CR=1 FL=1